MVSHRDYSKQLGKDFPDCGFPLFDPQPSLTENGTLKPRVEIGDVGYVDRNLANFVTLFNLHQSPGQAALSSRFTFPQWKPTFIMANTDTTRTYSSHYMLCQEVGGGLEAPILPGASVGAGVEVLFKSSSSAGAILVIHGGDRPILKDATSEYFEAYKRYVNSDIKPWISLCETHGKKLSDIFLVTGVHRTTAWATAAAAASKKDIFFKGDVVTRALNGKATTKFSWHKDKILIQKESPELVKNLDPVESTRLLEAAESHTPGDTQESTKSTPDFKAQDSLYIHTTFIRRLRFKRRRMVPFKIKAGGKPRDVDVGDDEDPAEANTTSNIVESPESEEFTDALTSILDYILEHSDAEVAMAHDTDLPLFEQLVAYKSNELPTYIDVHNDVGCLNRAAMIEGVLRLENELSSSTRRTYWIDIEPAKTTPEPDAVVEGENMRANNILAPGPGNRWRKTFLAARANMFELERRFVTWIPQEASIKLASILRLADGTTMAPISVEKLLREVLSRVGRCEDDREKPAKGNRLPGPKHVAGSHEGQHPRQLRLRP